MPMDKIMSQLAVVSGQLSELTASTRGLDAKSDEQILTDTGFFWRERNGVKVLICRELEENGFVNGFSTRLGGVSTLVSVPPALAGGASGSDLNLAGFDEDAAENIAENRRRFLAVFGGELRLATVWQVHGDTIKTVVTISDIGNSDDRADAAVSNLKNVVVGVKTADCVPILIGDPVTGAFAAVHAGWRGTAQSIVSKTVGKLKEVYGANPADMIAAIGPAAGCGNYEIGNDVIEAFAANFTGSEKYFTRTRDGHALVDLHQANRDQLMTSGARAANIYTAPFCTIERPDLFFSYRLEKTQIRQNRPPALRYRPPRYITRAVRVICLDFGG